MTLHDPALERACAPGPANRPGPRSLDGESRSVLRAAVRRFADGFCLGGRRGAGRHEQALDGAPADEVFAHDGGHIVEGHAGVPGAALGFLGAVDDDGDAVLAGVEAAGGAHAHRALEPAQLGLRLELLADGLRPLGRAAALRVPVGTPVGADEDVAREGGSHTNLVPPPRLPRTTPPRRGWACAPRREWPPPAG